MRIYSVGADNFGDRLNEMIMPRVFSEILDYPDITLMGIGTLINDWAIVDALGENRIWFSSGYGYSRAKIIASKIGKIYGVRGKLTASFLGLDSSLACGDGAYLLRDTYQSATVKLHKFSYIPHYGFAHDGWIDACALAGVNYIDPRNPVKDIIRDINQTEVMICEAMHGAIVADALRVPWIPVSSHESILSFKWQDWLSTINLVYNPHNISTFYARSGDDIARKLKYQFGSLLASTELNRIIKNANAYLSTNEACDRVIAKLHHTSAQIIKDFS